MIANPTSPDNLLLALTRLEPELPTLVGQDWPTVGPEVQRHLSGLRQSADPDLRLTAAVHLEQLLSPYAAVRSRILPQLHIQAGLRNMLDQELQALARAAGLEADAIDPALALALQAMQAELAEPVAAAEEPRLVKLGLGGRGGGQVVRLSNLIIDLGNLAELLAGSVLTAADVLATPHPLIVLAGVLLTIRSLQQGLTAPISEAEAGVFWGLIQAGGRDGAASQAAIAARTNQERARWGRPPLDDQAVEQALRRLQTLKCIAAGPDGEWRLLDRYEISA